MDSACPAVPFFSTSITLQRECVTLILRKTPVAAAVNILLAVLTWLAMPTTQPSWMLFIFIASAIRLIPIWLARRTPSIATGRTFHLLLLACLTLQGIGWGYCSTTLFFTVPQMHKFLVLAIVCGMVGGSTLTLAPSVVAHLCFTLPAALPLFSVMLLSGENSFRFAGIMGLIYLVTICLLSRNICDNHLNLLSSRKRLEQTSAELVRHQHHLEQLVDTRTRELERSKENYRQLIEEINDAIYEIDATGTISYVSPAITPLLGYLPEELVGSNVRSVAHPEDINLILFRIAAVLSGGEQYPIDSRFITKDGRHCWLRLSSKVVGVNGNFSKLRGVATCIDREKLAEEEKARLVRKFHQMRQRESIGTLAGGIAHDFNNLLMGIQGRISLLSMEFPAEHPSLDHARAIERYVTSGADLTKQLLATARGGKYDPQPTDIRDLVQQHIDLFGRTRKELNIEIELTESPLIAEVDKSQIQQVLLNMFVNSSQAMPQGGTLKITAGERELNPAFCRPYKIAPGSYIEITVTDTGIGMAPEILERIFDPFFTTKDMGRGTGLGLSSAHGIISNHHGCITVESNIGVGTTFCIYLPRSSRRPQDQSVSATCVRKGSETILLVDDEQMIIEVAGSILSNLGYTVITAGGAKEALEQLHRHGENIDIVMLDMIMPGIDGGQTFDSLRAVRPNLPILLSSGYSLNEQALAIMQRGCNGFIEKPFTLAALSTKIRAVLDQPA